MAPALALQNAIHSVFISKRNLPPFCFGRFAAIVKVAHEKNSFYINLRKMFKRQSSCKNMFRRGFKPLPIDLNSLNSYVIEQCALPFFFSVRKRSAYIRYFMDGP